MLPVEVVQSDQKRVDGQVFGTRLYLALAIPTNGQSRSVQVDSLNDTIPVTYVKWKHKGCRSQEESHPE